MSEINILDSLSALYQSLTKTEKRIADRLLEEPMFFDRKSLSELACDLNIGEATFIRFCRTLGFKGFAQFKLALAVELAGIKNENDEIVDSDILENDDSFQIAQKLKLSIQNVIDETVNLLNFKDLEEVVEQINKAKRIFFFGMGNSGLSAQEAKTKFMRIGLNVDAATNNHFMYMQAALMEKGDLAIGISHSGKSIEIVEGLRIAKENGATTVCITHHLRSPVTKMSDYVLVNGNKELALQGDSLRTKIAQLYILDLLYILTIKDFKEQAINSKQKTLKVLSNSIN